MNFKKTIFLLEMLAFDFCRLVYFLHFLCLSGASLTRSFKAVQLIF